MEKILKRILSWVEGRQTITVLFWLDKNSDDFLFRVLKLKDFKVFGTSADSEKYCIGFPETGMGSVHVTQYYILYHNKTHTGIRVERYK